MQLIEWSVGLGGKRAPKTNEILLQHLPEYDEVSWIFANRKDLSYDVASVNTWVAGKQNSSFNLIQSPPTFPTVWSYQIFASPVRENGDSFTVRCFGSNRVWFNSSR